MGGITLSSIENAAEGRHALFWKDITGEDLAGVLFRQVELLKADLEIVLPGETLEQGIRKHLTDDWKCYETFSTPETLIKSQQALVCDYPDYSTSTIVDQILETEVGNFQATLFIAVGGEIGIIVWNGRPNHQVWVKQLTQAELGYLFSTDPRRHLDRLVGWHLLSQLEIRLRSIPHGYDSSKPNIQATARRVKNGQKVLRTIFEFVDQDISIKR